MTDTDKLDLSALTDDQKAEAAKNWDSLAHFLMTLTERATNNEILISTGDDGLWMQTALVLHTDTSRISGKVGDFPYQPLGICTEGAFIPNAANKVFWSRKFAFVKLTGEDIQLPFKSVRTVLNDANLSLTDAMLKQAEDVLTEIRGELDKLVAMNADERKQETDSIREYNKLLCMKFPPLDGFLKSNIQSNPELAGILDKMDPVALLATEAEWIDAKVQDEKFKRRIGGLTTVRTDLSVAERTLELFKGAVVEAASEDKFSKLLNGAYATDHLLRETVDRLVMKSVPSSEIVKQLIPQLERRITNG